MHVQFRHDAPRRPKIDFGGVGALLVLEQQLGRSEPARDYVVSEVVVVVDLVSLDGCQAEVAYL